MLRLKRNWSEYNKALVNRGNITFWIDEKAIQKWQAPHQKHKKGRPFMFSDEAIKTALAIRFIYSVPLRALEGLLKAFFKCLEVPLAVPSYTQICKRMRKLPYEQHFSLKKKAAHIVFDTSGVKVYGEGEWKIKKHGKSCKRGWRKLHIAIDEKTQEVVFTKTSLEYEHDTKYLDEILNQRKMQRFLIDGIGDRSSLYKSCCEKKIELMTPPQKGGVIRKEPWMSKRNDHLRHIAFFGGDEIARSLWSKLSGYSKRVTVESAIARWKRLFGGVFKSRLLETQYVETYVKSLILNKINVNLIA